MNSFLDPEQGAWPDFAAIAPRPLAGWSGGDYAVLGTTLQIVAENLAEAADVCAGELVLDVAAGNGNATLAAARRFARVTSTDQAPSLLAKAKARARAEGLDVRFQVVDAQALPFADAAFDVTLSTFGAMFVGDHERTAHEMLRVTRPQGRIGLASWTPDSFIGRLLKVIAVHVPPPAGVKPAALWGTESHLRALFGAEAAHIHCRRRVFHFRYASPAHWVQVFRSSCGPTHKAFAALDTVGRRALERHLNALLDALNTAGTTSLVVPSEYLEAVITKRAMR